MIVDRKTVFLVIVICNLFSDLIAQPQHNNWYFGFNAGITFSNGAPQAILNSPLNTDEGVASISDQLGQTLFFTNGEKVYDASNQIMVNGSGLAGSFTTAQSSLIIPFINQQTKYYLFTQGPQAGAAFPGNLFGGLAYSIIDLSLNGGLGAVTVKNIILTDSTCESLAATSHPSGKQFWVASHKWNSNEFYVYKVDCNGVNSSPVISSAGRQHSDTTAGNVGSIGCMKFSPDGTKLAIIWSKFSDDVYSTAQLDIFNFNNLNGQLTLLDTVNFLSGPLLQERGYGVEFSPNSRFIYCSTNGLNGGIAFTHLYQMDLSQTDINGTKIQIASEFKAFGSLQLAPDNKIYIARLNGYQYLSALNFPDSLGAASQFTDLAVSLAGNYSTWGLPNNWNNFNTVTAVNLLVSTDTTVCEFTPVTLIAERPYNDFNYSFIWSNGNAGRIVTITAPGTYTVTAINGCDTINDSFVLSNEKCNCIINVPNIVTLNNDGLNDRFTIETIDCKLTNFNISIFNRWGNKIYDSNNINFEFFPEISGTYFYIAEWENVIDFSNKRTIKKGTITAIDQ